MANQTEQIAASKQRDQIPDQWRLVFASWSLKSLASLAADPVAHEKVRAYAMWEMEFRIAFDKADPPEPELPSVDRGRYRRILEGKEQPRTPLQEGKEGIGE